MAHKYQFARWQFANRIGATIRQMTGEDMGSADFLRLTFMDDLTRTLESRNQKSTGFKKKKDKVFDMLDDVCKPMEQLGNIAASGTSIAWLPTTLHSGAPIHVFDQCRMRRV
jgi:hypothetical protein